LVDVPTIDVEAINACMRAAQEAKPKFGELADGFPEVCTSPAVYGTLPSSGAVSAALDAVNSAMHSELGAAETTLEQVARALDAVAQSVRNTEDNNVRSMTSR
jgi:hypothetical protein